MKGLLRKDFCMIMKNCRFYLVALLCVLGYTAFGEEARSIILLYPALLVVVLPVNLYSYDERDGWEHYCGTMPFSRKQLVTVKYLIMLLGLTVVLLLVTVGQMVFHWRNGGAWQEFWPILCVIFVLTVLASSFLFPVVFRFGTEKGRIFYFVVLVVMAAVFGALDAADVTCLLDALRTWALPVIFAVAALLLAVSWCVSIRLYQKREV